MKYNNPWFTNFLKKSQVTQSFLTNVIELKGFQGDSDQCDQKKIAKCL